jgi:ATP phosphoribosyltransferase
VFDEHDRSLVAHVQNYDLDVLFVRTNDIIEFVGDGVADLGITGIDLVTETSAELPRIRDLGYGRCRLAAAVPNDSPYQAIEDLAGLRVATAHPNTARRFFESRSIPVDVIPISGAVEVAPRLGLAEAIVDLISTGSTMVMNGLRPIGDVLASEAVLVANPAAHRERAAELTAIDTMLTAVTAARGQKYLLMNAPATKLAELEAMLPGLESPSVIPLAHEGMIAIHSVVASDEVWGLLPRLKAAGASGILVLPIEKIVP